MCLPTSKERSTILLKHGDVLVLSGPRNLCHYKVWDVYAARETTSTAAVISPDTAVRPRSHQPELALAIEGPMAEAAEETLQGKRLLLQGR